MNFIEMARCRRGDSKSDATAVRMAESRGSFGFGGRSIAHPTRDRAGARPAMRSRARDVLYPPSLPITLPMKFAATFLLLAVTVPSLLAASGAENAPGFPANTRQIADALSYRQGEIVLGSSLAKVNVPADFRYLGPDDAQTVLTKIWGNPPTDSKPLGMLLRADANPSEPNTWAVIIHYEESGYVKDDDAHEINYTELLKQIQAGAKEENRMRAKQGYPAVDIVGWAAPPRYDAAAKKLYWAKEVRFAGEAENTLNYNIRMLGRRGVLVLTAVASIAQLGEIEKATPAILSMVEFQPGNRYADFNPATDKTATYGLAALVAGGVLAKGGFFKMLFAGALAAKKLVIVGLIGLAALVKKLYFAKKEPLA